MTATFKDLLGSMRGALTMTAFRKGLFAGCLLGIGIVIATSLISGRLSKEGDITSGKLGAAQDRNRRAIEETLNKTPVLSGAVYTRWGRTVCPPTASVIYKGQMAGDHLGHHGGGNQYLCLPEDPEWGKVVPGLQPHGVIFGVEFSAPSDILFSKENAPTLTNHDANCVICRTTHSTQLMVPGRMTCMEGWTVEYHGYLMSAKHNDKGQRNYVCVDIAPEADRDGYRADGGASLWPIEARCGSLSCPKYIAGNELTCVVCSQ